MKAVAHKLPITFEKRMLAPDELKVSATLEELWEQVGEVDYTIEYLNGEIISYIGHATDTHETLVMTLGWLFNNYYHNLPDYRVLGSNVQIFSEMASGVLNAVLSVIKGPSDFKILPSGRLSKSTIRNPEIVVEVLSPGTRSYDISEKLACYKTIPTLQHVLFVEQRRPYTSVYSRLPEPDQWLNTDCRLLTDTVAIGEITVPMREIYLKALFSTTA